jgi:hypothetical protein
MKNFIRTAAIAAIATLASCITDGGFDRTHPTPDATGVIFSEGVAEYTPAATRAMDGHPIENVPGTGNENKGMIPDGKSFGVFALLSDDTEVGAYDGLANNTPVTRDTHVDPDTSAETAVYNYSPQAVWPSGNDEKLSFFAYYPYMGSDATKNVDASNNGGLAAPTVSATDKKMSIVYNAPAESEKHIDLMFAVTESLTPETAKQGAGTGAPDGAVGLVFHHALSRMQFSARIAGFDNGDVVKVTGIEVRGIVTKGTLVVDDVKYGNEAVGVWTPDLATKAAGHHVMDDAHIRDLALDEDLESLITATTSTTTAGDMIVIPQTTVGMKLVIKTTVNGTARPDYEIPLDAAPDMAMNYIYNYGVTIMPNAANFVVDVLPWNGNGRDVTMIGEYWLQTDKGEVEIGGAIGNSAPMQISTNYKTDDKDGWKIEKGIDPETDVEFDWFSVSPVNAVSGSAPVNVTVTATVANYTHIDKVGWFTVRAGNMHKMVEVRQAPIYQYVMAPPGVVGIARSELYKPIEERELTIRGSSTYKGLIDPNTGRPYLFIDEVEGGPLDEEVYVVYFKEGSMVAILGGALDVNAHRKGDTWSVDDVVWVNHEYAGPDITTWSSFTGSQSEDETMGYGDVCDEITGGEWMTPTGHPWTSTKLYNGSYTPFGPQASDGYKPWWESIAQYTRAIDIGVTYAGVTGYGAITPNGDMFVPASGYRDEDGVWDTNTVSESGVGGDYWTSTPGSGSGKYYLEIGNRGVIAGNSYTSGYGLAVRCVPNLPNGVPAPKGVIGYYVTGPKKGELTLDGDRDLPGSAQTRDFVHVAYFKWGSLVATSSYNNDNKFDSNDIVAVASQTYDLNGLKNSMAGKTNADAWNLIKDGTNASVTLTHSDVLTEKLPATTYSEQGIGDPCVFFGSEWRMPTAHDNIDYAGFVGVEDVSNAGTDYIWTANGKNASNPGYAAFPKSPETEARLPAAGFRSASTGVVPGGSGNQGEFGYYWSSQLLDNLKFTPDPLPGSSNRGYAVASSISTQNHGYPIRCIQSAGIRGKDVTFEYGGGVKPLEVTSRADGDLNAPWEITGYDTDTDGLFDDPAPAWLAIDRSSATPTVAVQPFSGVSTNTEDVALKGAPVVTARRDLSYSYDPAQRNTANSYIVNAAGNYSLPLIYGNAIINGARNEAAYRYTGTANSNVLQTFVNHANQPINSPYILNVTNIAASDLEAVVVWQDSPGLIVNPAISSESGEAMLHFDVPQSHIAQGNAIVAVRQNDPAKTILWSWHIWVTPLVKADAASREHDKTVNFQKYTYNFMKYNLGWMTKRTVKYGAGSGNDQPRAVRVRIEQTGDTDAGPAEFTVTHNSGSVSFEAVNPSFQWGRKDPMPAGTGVENVERNLYGELLFSRTVGATDITSAIRNPWIFIANDTNDWLAGGIHANMRNLWSANNTVFTVNDNEVIKTVYDPSPVGFKVPESGSTTGFTSDGENKYDSTSNTVNGTWQTLPTKGWNFYLDETKSGTAFWPSTESRGTISGNDGMLGGVGVAGNYWFANPAANNTGRVMWITNTQTHPENGQSRSQGFAVRPVKDEAPIPPPFVALNLAAPGVIGYIKGTDELTLAGSKEFKYTDVATGADRVSTEEFGPISNETVYVAYFKFGSLIALSSEDRGDDTFIPSKDVIRVPEGFTKSSITGYTSLSQPQYANIPPNVPAYLVADFSGNKKNISHPDYNTQTNWKAGKGDPCIYYFGRDDAIYDEFDKGWRLPVGGIANGGWNGGSFGTSSSTGGILWAATGGAAWTQLENTSVTPTVIIDGAVAGNGAGQNDWTMYLTAAGYRRHNQDYGDIYIQGKIGSYWSSTAQSINTSTQNAFGYSMSFENEERLLPVFPNGNSQGTNTGSGLPVRCVLPPQVLTVVQDGGNIPHDGGEDQEFTVTASNDGRGNNVEYEILYPNGSGGWQSTKPANLSWLKDASLWTPMPSGIRQGAQPNTALQPRSTKLLVRQKSGAKPAQQEITVTQDAAPPFINVDKTSLTFDHTNLTQQTFTVTSNVAWSLPADFEVPDWLNINTTSGSAGTTIVRVSPKSTNRDLDNNPAVSLAIHPVAKSRLTDLVFTAVDFPATTATVGVTQKSDCPIASIRLYDGTWDGTIWRYKVRIVVDGTPDPGYNFSFGFERQTDGLLSPSWYLMPEGGGTSTMQITTPGTYVNWSNMPTFSIDYTIDPLIGLCYRHNAQTRRFEFVEFPKADYLWERDK